MFLISRFLYRISNTLFPRQKKIVYVPYMIPNQTVMDFYKIESMSCLKLNSWGVLEPPGEPDKRQEIPAMDAMIVTVACNRDPGFFDEQKLIFVPTCSLSRGLSGNVNLKIRPSGDFWVRTRFKVLDLKFPKKWHKIPLNYRKFKFEPGFVISSKFLILT